ncbi:MAG: type II toxin-antitoxin system VapC family toxin [Campylobacterales bacterium]|nr:type II toxin-antitoxin system VapC family toxin [Campylobacterales bacterium]
MANKLFLDTNIIIDIIDEARPSHPKAKATLIKIIQDDYEVYVSEDMISTVYYILRGNAKVLHFFKSILSQWHIVPFGTDVIAEAIEVCISSGKDLEDTMQCLCAKKHGCTLLLTSDQTFIDCGVALMTYEQFLQKV